MPFYPRKRENGNATEHPGRAQKRNGKNATRDNMPYGKEKKRNLNMNRRKSPPKPQRVTDKDNQWNGGTLTVKMKEFDQWEESSETSFDLNQPVLGRGQLI